MCKTVSNSDKFLEGFKIVVDVFSSAKLKDHIEIRLEKYVNESFYKYCIDWNLFFFIRFSKKTVGTFFEA